MVYSQGVIRFPGLLWSMALAIFIDAHQAPQKQVVLRVGLLITRIPWCQYITVANSYHLEVSLMMIMTPTRSHSTAILKPSRLPTTGTAKRVYITFGTRNRPSSNEQQMPIAESFPQNPTAACILSWLSTCGIYSYFASYVLSRMLDQDTHPK